MAWQQANLDRLRRSFIKLGAGADLATFDARFWHPLLAAYHRALADRVARGGAA
jgi:3-deoxy-D-manno-octulosonic acid kinase